MIFVKREQVASKRLPIEEEFYSESVNPLNLALTDQGFCRVFIRVSSPIFALATALWSDYLLS
jgi:hypothetical protein